MPKVHNYTSLSHTPARGEREFFVDHAVLIARSHPYSRRSHSTRRICRTDIWGSWTSAWHKRRRARWRVWFPPAWATCRGGIRSREPPKPAARINRRSPSTRRISSSASVVLQGGTRKVKGCIRYGVHSSNRAYPRLSVRQSAHIRLSTRHRTSVRPSVLMANKLALFLSWCRSHFEMGKKRKKKKFKTKIAEVREMSKNRM